MLTADRRDGRTDVLVALGAAALTITLLLVLPVLDAIDRDSLTARSLTAPSLSAQSPTTGTQTADALTIVGPAPFTLEWTLFALVVLAQAGALLAVRRRPRTVLLGVGALAALGSAIAPGDLHSLGEVAVIVAVVCAGLRVSVARLGPAVMAAAVLVVAAETIAGALRADRAGTDVAVGALAGSGQGLLQTIGTVGVPLLVAALIRSRREVRSAQRGEASAVARESDALVEAAVSRERAAMARELHDIAAHHLSGIALMAAVIDRQIDGDPVRAHEGVRQVREQSTAVLDDLRRLVGLLRDDGPSERAVESLAGIVDLVERARYRSDVRLDVRTDGEPRRVGADVGPLAQLAAYRTVQESLANAALHAPAAPCTVTIDDRDPEQVTVRIENGPVDGMVGVVATPSAPSTASTAGGNGLRGMRERAELVGARLRVGPTDAGGWSVVLTLGREARSASDTPASVPEAGA